MTYAVLSWWYIFCFQTIYWCATENRFRLIKRWHIDLEVTAHFPSSRGALVWHSAALLLPAKHMAPSTLHPPSDPVWELLPHELWDRKACWKIEVAFFLAFPDRPLFPFLCKILYHCIFLSFPSVPFYFLLFLAVVAPTEARVGLFIRTIFLKNEIINLIRIITIIINSKWRIYARSYL